MNNIFTFIYGITLGCILGIASVNLFLCLSENYHMKEEIKGVRLNADSWTDALNKSHTAKSGNWICVKVDDITPEQAFSICQHEVAHEIFATYCQSHFEECVNLTRG